MIGQIVSAFQNPVVLAAAISSERMSFATNVGCLYSSFCCV